MMDISNHDSLLDDPYERSEWASEQVDCEDEWDEDVDDGEEDLLAVETEDYTWDGYSHGE